MLEKKVYRNQPTGMTFAKVKYFRVPLIIFYYQIPSICPSYTLSSYVEFNVT